MRIRTAALAAGSLLTVFLATLQAQITTVLPAQSAGSAFNQKMQARLAARGLYGARPQESRWLDEGERYTVLEPSAANPAQADLVAYDTASGKRNILVPAAKFMPAGAKEPLSIEEYSWSADKQHLLIFTNTVKVWRLHTRGDYWVLDLASGKLAKLGGDAPASTLMFAKFSPDSRSVAFVRANNVCVQDLASLTVHALTSDGSEDIINGTTDWVTEEEFDLRDAFRWSPDSKSILYLQQDQSGVATYTLINDTKALYPVTFEYRYPQPGTTNSAVRLGVVPATGGQTTWIRLPGDPRNHYIPRFEWVGNQVSLEYLNRLQNLNQVFLAIPQTGEAHPILEDRDAAWVDYNENLQWLQSHGTAEKLLWLSERDGWRHAYLVAQDRSQPTLITNFPADVIGPVGLDEHDGYFYFLASPSDPIRTYLYRSRLDGTGTPERVTPADQTGHHSYDLSPNGRWAIHEFSSASIPPRFELVHLPASTVARTLVTNDDLAAKFAALGYISSEEFAETPIGGGLTLSTSITKPPHFDSARKWPVIVYVYGEPADTTVRDTWEPNFGKVLASQGYVILSFDNQGTPAPRGRAWRKAGYGAIGVLSTQQQAAAIRSFAASHAWVDLSRMAMYGQSGGATNTLNMMFRNPGLFSTGMALSPVADQTHYDSIYQERYMGLPQDNPTGYHDGSAINFAEGLAGNLLIVHGSGDDNVHFQGTELLVNRLIQLGKVFEFMDYPNRTHSLSEGPGTTLHLNNLMDRFLEEHVPPGPR